MKASGRIINKMDLERKPGKMKVLIRANSSME
jgi:hypothetical protein